jgi:hypothetical protein
MTHSKQQLHSVPLRSRHKQLRSDLKILTKIGRIKYVRNRDVICSLCFVYEIIIADLEDKIL